MELRAVRCNDNSNVSKILPLTTLRTIDLGGKKISGCLFSRFCGKTRVFFEGNVAPEIVHEARCRIRTCKLLRSGEHTPFALVGAEA